ncbi:MBL fold metallo-hydrolase [Segetibacter aerophilus]|uniref:MBL fold metallo-hydrolase n=1 Tax=Segetibacter aerophilus TaxID=670293 RepID=A0A512BG03_9BACT|nr:MBL fold metallo-hydrolase [Segetibacter aerophilus]GEO10889.1 MBL fold metallo-hydrolase [Segetibacter aerophilus]
MFIKQLYTNCLSEAAYYIESEGEAAIIDPLRDIEEYLLLAKERQATIKYIFETHFHADFVSGHIDLSKATSAPIIYGPETETRFKATVAKDGETFRIGKLQVIVLHTPGHTVESTCFLLKDENSKDYAVFTGDTLFVGDVGRPDLVSADTTKEEMAGLLYDSLHEKILPLSDNVIVYPAHGPGSSCGKNIGSNTQSTIGEQKQTNYALQQDSKEAFVKVVTEGLVAPPNYFPINAVINKEGYDSIDTVLDKGLTALSVEEFKQQLENDAIIVDTRNASVFSSGFIPGSIFIGLEGKFAEWAGSLLPFDKPLILVTEEGQEKETVTRLARVGLSNVQGYLKGSFAAWQNAGEKIDLLIEVEADELAMDIPFDENLVVVDVRKEVEFADGHVKEAVNIPLSNMVDPASMADIEDTDNLYLHCGSGFRSTIAASLLKRQGIHNVRNVVGGWDTIKAQPGIKTEKDASVLN